MTKQGWKNIILRQEIVDDLEGRAKSEGVSVSKVIESFLKGGRGSNLIVGQGKPLSLEDIRDIVDKKMREIFEEWVLKGSKAIEQKQDLGGKQVVMASGLSKKEIKEIAEEMELTIGMYIESGIAKALKGLRCDR